MNSLEKYQKAVALADANYDARLAEAKRLMGEARALRKEDYEKARTELGIE